jgi:hypothetical protein
LFLPSLGPTKTAFGVAVGWHFKIRSINTLFFTDLKARKEKFRVFKLSRKSKQTKGLTAQSVLFNCDVRFPLHYDTEQATEYNFSGNVVKGIDTEINSTEEEVAGGMFRAPEVAIFRIL